MSGAAALSVGLLSLESQVSCRGHCLVTGTYWWLLGMSISELWSFKNKL